MKNKTHSFWENVWARFITKKSGILGLIIFCAFMAVAIWAPFFACSKPIVVIYDHKFFFPLFQYLESSAFFTKKIDIFFNTIGLFIPFFFASYLFVERTRKLIQICIVCAIVTTFTYFGFISIYDPAISRELNKQKQETLLQKNAKDVGNQPARSKWDLPSWQFELDHMNEYCKLNLVLEYKRLKDQHEKITSILRKNQEGISPYTLWAANEETVRFQLENLSQEIKNGLESYKADVEKEQALQKQGKSYHNLDDKEKIETELAQIQRRNQAFEELENRRQFLLDRQQWLEGEQSKLSYVLYPLIRNNHWQDDVGGDQSLNNCLPMLELSRINRHDLMAAIIYGTRISLFVGLASCLLSLILGIPLGLISGFYGSKIDIFLCRFMEVWESMPAFFMLLLIVTLLQTKSIFLIIVVIGVFSWTSTFRFVRAETLKQREMTYVEASRALGFSDRRIILGHILPNSILAVVALLPFDIMSAITREAGLAFLGLGEEQSCSWGVLMDEGRAAFPAESALLWPPAIVLTILLISIAFIGEALQSAMDPKATE